MKITFDKQDILWLGTWKNNSMVVFKPKNSSKRFIDDAVANTLGKILDWLSNW